MDLSTLHLLPIASTEGGEHHGPGFFGLVFYVGLVLLILGLVIWQVRGDLKNRIFKNPLAQAAEQMYLFIEAMCVNIIGAHGRKYITFIGTLWLIIFVGNTVALFFASAPTADLSFNLAMAVIAIVYVQHEGVKGHADALRAKGKDPFTAWFLGFFLHLKHFAGPSLPPLMAIFITPLLFAVELISEAMKNVSLSLRLFGNIHGGHTAVEALNAVGQDYFFPWGGLLLLVKLLTVIVQALVFTLLTCVYISLVVHHDHGDDHGHEGDHGHGEPAPAH